jgi:hypothetical protein
VNNENLVDELEKMVREKAAAKEAEKIALVKLG